MMINGLPVWLNGMFAVMEFVGRHLQSVAMYYDYSQIVSYYWQYLKVLGSGTW